MDAHTLEDEFEELLAAAYRSSFGKDPTDLWLAAIASRAGTRGAVATLNQAGDLLGVSRERIRQVMARITPALQGMLRAQLWMIALTIAQYSPAAEPVGRYLAPLGLSRPTLTGEGFLNLLKLTGTSAGELIGDDLVVVDGWLVRGTQMQVTKSLPMANRQTSSFGMTTITTICHALMTPSESPDPAAVQRILRAEPTVRWFGDWLWVHKDDQGPHANRLVNTARSILSVNSPQTITSIHEGAQRLWKFRRLELLPPVEAMRAFFGNHSGFEVDGDQVRALEPLDYHEVLGGVTATMIDILKSSPYQVMDRQSLREACREAGIAPGTSTVWTTYAEWMQKFAQNVWGLRGSEPDMQAVERIRRAARARSEAEPHRKSSSLFPGGAIQTMDVTTSCLATGVLSFAPEVHRLVAGSALDIVRASESLGMAKFGASHFFSWGWLPMLRSLDAKPGDVLRISIDPAAARAEVQLGGPELWGP